MIKCLSVFCTFVAALPQNQMGVEISWKEIQKTQGQPMDNQTQSYTILMNFLRKVETLWSSSRGWASDI